MVWPGRVVVVRKAHAARLLRLLALLALLRRQRLHCRLLRVLEHERAAVQVGEQLRGRDGGWGGRREWEDSGKISRQ